jgi:hypothetical protein
VNVSADGRAADGATVAAGSDGDEADTPAGAGGTPAGTAAGAGGTAPARWRGLIDRDALFPAGPAEPACRSLPVAAVAVVAGAALSLARTGGHGPFDSLWAEDGSGFVHDSLNLTTVDALVKGLNGYFVLLPRLLAEPVSLLPVERAPVVISTGAAVCTALFALTAYLASAGHLRSVTARLIVSVPVVATPVAGAVVANNVATLQFAALYAAFWAVVWVPTGRWTKALALGVAVLTGLSTILVLALVPVAVLRVLVRRDRWSVVIGGAVCLTAVVQCLALLLGATSREGLSAPRLDPLWALLEWVLWAMPYSVFGTTILSGRSTPVRLVLGLLAYAVLAAVVVLALRRATRPAWGLAVMATVTSAAILAAEVMGMGYPGTEDSYLTPEKALMSTERYLLAPVLLLIVAVVALLRPDPAQGRAPRDRVGAPRRPLLAYGLLLAVVCATQFRPDAPRNHTLSWSGVIAQARATCVATGAVKVEAPFGGPVWYPRPLIPCRKLRD